MILNAPVLDDYLRAYLRAYRELDTCRSLGFGAVGPIPWTAIDAYGRRHRIDGDDFEDLVTCIMAMDDTAQKTRKSSGPPEQESGHGQSKPVLNTDRTDRSNHPRGS